MTLGEDHLAKTSELEVLKQACKEAATQKRIKGSDLERLSNAFGQRFAKAWKAVEDQRVKKYVFKDFMRGKELKELMLWEPGADGKGAELKRKKFDVQFWHDPKKNCSPRINNNPETISSIIFRFFPLDCVHDERDHLTKTPYFRIEINSSLNHPCKRYGI